MERQGLGEPRTVCSSFLSFTLSLPDRRNEIKVREPEKNKQYQQQLLKNIRGYKHFRSVLMHMLAQ